MSQNIQRKIVIASDHAGYLLKSELFKHLKAVGFDVTDFGCDSSEISVDYPDFANLVSAEIAKNPDIVGILVCGSGVGISIAANRNKSVRAVNCTSQKMAELSRKHNDANVICFGSRLISEDEAKKMLDIFLKTEFEGGRHENRVKKIS